MYKPVGHNFGTPEQKEVATQTTITGSQPEKSFTEVVEQFRRALFLHRIAVEARENQRREDAMRRRQERGSGRQSAHRLRNNRL
uniref:Transposase n=1 Tax=Caenorhabditis tropicalis TaxID=1561998 RepID=A0A1I7TSP7_9PELO